ncbi:MAG: DUF481 domain-containing protein [Planctomycetota bacterium]|jgi:putative salt-induced outer membrane protein YdiY
MRRVALFRFPLLFLVCLLPVFGQEKPDEVVLDNGDRITGEVLGAADGKLFLKTPYAEKVELEMAAVRGVAIRRPVTLVLKNGDRVRGTLRMEEGGEVQVEWSGGSASVPWGDVLAVNPEPEEPARYTGSIALGTSIQRGNVDRIAVTVSAAAERRTDDDRLGFKLLWNYAEEEEDRTARDVFAGLKYDYFFSEAVYGYVAGELLSDEFKDLDLLVTAGVGLGWQIIDEEDMGLAAEAGVAYVSENFDAGEDDHYVAGRIAGKFSWTISGIVTFTDEVAYVPSFEETEYRARNEAGFVNALGGGWSMKISNILDYDSDPSPGVERLDVLYLISLQYAFK